MRSIEVHPVDAARWPDLVDLFGPSGAYSGCWCMWFRIPGGEFSRNGNGGNRAALEDLAANDAQIGLIGYADGQAVGWAALAPRAAYTRILRSPTLKPADQERGIWSVPCFFTRRGHRGEGVAEAMLAAAVRAARRGKAGALEGYPVDTDTGPVPPAAELYTGTVRLFERAGFEVARRPVTGRRIIMRRAL
ncbi:MAG TPA: GNAT family N-acetyltransferase [Asanoa sp.]